MANPNATQDMERYGFANLAARLAGDESLVKFVPGALYGQASKLGINVNNAKGFIEGSLASDQGISTAIGTYAKKFNSAFESLTLKEYIASRESGLSYIDPAKLTEIKAKVAGYENETIGSLTKKLAKLRHASKSPDKSEADKARKDLEKYKEVQIVMGVLEDESLRELLPDAVKFTSKRNLEALVD